MKKLIRLLVCALPLLAVGAVQAEKTQATDTSVTWTRISLQVPYGVQLPVLTVPTTATKPYFLRQSFTTVQPASYNALDYYSQCNLNVNGATALPLSVGSTMDMNVPFKAGDVITVVCANSAFWAFVFSY